MIKRIKARVKKPTRMAFEFAEEVLRCGTVLADYRLSDSVGSVFRIGNVEYNRKLYFVVIVTTMAGSRKVLECLAL